ncbi:MAG TPA: hypothetical protein VN089_05580, partial [Duganella sp.]|nr:hypothetical protein [Duganella sp.]
MIENKASARYLNVALLFKESMTRRNMWRKWFFRPMTCCGNTQGLSPARLHVGSFLFAVLFPSIFHFFPLSQNLASGFRSNKNKAEENR